MKYKTKRIIKSIFLNNRLGKKLYADFSHIARKKRMKLSDEEYIKMSFKENTGGELNLNNPMTFNEKMIWLSLHDRDELKVKCADKYKVRDYISERGYSHILNDLYGVYDSTNEIDFSKLPSRFFIKTNHDSGTYALIDQNDKKNIKRKLSHIKKSLTHK